MQECLFARAGGRITYSVLYVDDEPGLLEIGKLFLEQDGQFSVDTIISAPDALTLLNTKTFDAIISDYQMPGMDGIAFLKRVRAAFGDVPFILFTGRGREEVVIDAIDNGVDFYVQKGGDPRSQFMELGHKILKAVQKRRADTGIRDLERRQTDIINFLPDPTFAIDTAGVVIAWNRAMEEMTGVAAAAILGKGNYEAGNAFYHERRPMLIDLVLAADGQFEREKYIYVTHTGTMLTGESTFHGRDGSQLQFWGKASQLFDEKGNLTGAIESLRDITGKKLAEEALQESEKRLRAIIYSMQIGVMIVDATTHRILDANDKALDLVGRSRDETIGKVCHQFICPAETGKCPVTDLKQTVDCSDRVLINQNGKKIPILKSVIQTMLDGKEVLVESFLDISESRKAEDELRAAYEQLAAAEEELRGQYDELVRHERELRESGENFQALVEGAPDAIYISIEERFAYVNPAMVRLMGASSADQLLGMSLYDRIHPSFHEGIRERARVVTGEHKPVGLKETTYLKMDGTPVEIESAVATFRYQGRFAGLVILRDITGRRQAERRLQESEEKYRELVEASPDIIWEIDSRGNFVAISSQSGRYLGYAPGDLIGKPFLSLVRPEARESVMKVFMDTTREKTPFIMLEVPATHRDGHPLVVEIRSIRVHDATGRMTGARGVATDITERKQAEEALREANRKLKLLSGITRHDINNQLTILKGYLIVLERKLQDRSLAIPLGKAFDAADQISAMIAFTKGYEEIGVQAPVWQDCRAIVDTAAHQAPTGAITVRNEIPAGTEIFADPLLVRVMYNLIDNAVRYGGKITSIRFSTQEAAGSHALVCEDNGDGVPAGEKERIFDRGFGKNTGLGLALSRDILSITGITIMETGEPGTGARFVMAVPEGSFRVRGAE
jgi:PAS domain S-box-containing protein